MDQFGEVISNKNSSVKKPPWKVWTIFPSTTFDKRFYSNNIVKIERIGSLS